MFLLVCFLAGGQRKLRPALREAALLTPVVGTFAFSVYRIAGPRRARSSGQLLWLVYEVGFLAMLFFLRREVITARSPLPPTSREAWLRRVTSFVGVYYVLWAACDLAILAGFDAGWALRALPNQLYYAWLVPFVHGRFFASSYSPEQHVEPGLEVARSARGLRAARVAHDAVRGVRAEVRVEERLRRRRRPASRPHSSRSDLRTSPGARARSSEVSISPA